MAGSITRTHCVVLACLAAMMLLVNPAKAAMESNGPDPLGRGKPLSLTDTGPIEAFVRAEELQDTKQPREILGGLSDPAPDDGVMAHPADAAPAPLPIRLVPNQRAGDPGGASASAWGAAGLRSPPTVPHIG